MKSIFKFLFVFVLCYTSVAQEKITQPKTYNIEIILFKQNQHSEESYFPYKKFNPKKTHKFRLYSYNNNENLYLINIALQASQKIQNTLSNNDVILHNILVEPYNPLLSNFNNWENYDSTILLPTTNKTLNNIAKKIAKTENRDVIIHLAWKLTPELLNKNIEFILDKKTLNNSDYITNEYANITGAFNIKFEKYFQLNTSISMLDNNNKRHLLTAARRMKKNQLNYIDQNSYGMLILVNENK